MFGTDAVPTAHAASWARRIVGVAAFGAALFGVDAGHSYPVFAPPSRTYETAGRVTALAVGDMNGDGKPDLVATNYTAHVVLILLGSGDGRFGEPITAAAGISPASLAVADLDSNGAMDILIGLQSGIGILMGQGGGSFAPIAVRSIQGRAWGILPCLLNPDTHPDLVYWDANGQAVQSMLGNGDGTFGSVLVRSGLPNPNGVALGDLNGDGTPDLLVGTGDCSGELSRALGNGDGSFGSVLQLDPLVCNPYSPAIGDATGDGRSDAVVSVLGRSLASVYPGNGDGTFGARTDYVIGAASFELLLKDFNLDGRLDIATASASAGVVSTMLASTTGLLPRQDCGVGVTLRAMASGDFNRDGLPDLVVGGFSSKRVTILLNSGGTLPLAVPNDPTDGTLFALHVLPSPLRGSSRVIFSLPTSAPVRLSIFDLAGRRVADRDLGELGSGTHEVPLGLDASQTRTGFYVVRVSTGSARATIGAPFVK